MVDKMPQRSKISSLVESNEGRIIISLLLGFGLATLFRKVCKDKSCIVIKGPKMSDVQNNYYKINDKCYKYEPEVVPCTSAEDVVATS